MEIIGLCEDINDFNFYFYFYNIDYILSLFSFFFLRITRYYLSCILE